MAVVIVQEQPDTADAMELIAELEAILEPNYPPESRHGFSVEQLLRQGVAFFVSRVDGIPAACGGVKLYDTDYAEVKRLYVRPQFRGSGLARLMLDHLAAYALQHTITILRLETGIHQKEAINLYERYGFRRIPPFGQYVEDPVSLCYEKRLTPPSPIISGLSLILTPRSLESLAALSIAWKRRRNTKEAKHNRSEKRKS